MVTILERYKNKNGKTESYLAVIDGHRCNVPLDSLKSTYKNNIENAYLVNGEYRAKRGFKIETVIDDRDFILSGINLKHNGINTKLVHDFSKRKTYENIENDIIKKYKITNLFREPVLEEALYIICDTLLTDYWGHLANYEGYIQKGMNLRLLMELRNTAIQDLTKEELGQFNDCKTPLEVVNKRAKVMHRFANDDVVEPWQLYFLSMKTKKIFKAYENSDIDFRIDFEDCYEDTSGIFLTKDILITDFARNMRKKEGAIYKSYLHPY